MSNPNRVSYLTVAQDYNLRQACGAVDKAFDDVGFGLYHVGSSLIRPDWRDVDLRSILEDDKFDALFLNNNNRLRFLNVCISEWISARTGLPIDFQFQRQTNANLEFKGPRNWVGLPD